MKKIILGLFAGILISTSAIAQEKIAVVNIQYIASKIPQTAVMQQTLEQEFAGPTEEMKKIESDIKFNAEKYQRESMTMSDEKKTELQTKINELQKAYQANAQPLEQQMRRRQGEERNKVLALIQQAIQDVATDEKVDLVLAATAVTYVKPELDLSDKVVTKLTKLK